jgi:DNA polymerase-3 subunit delta'
MWLGIHGHDEVANQFRTAIRRRRLASTYLFVGPSGIGKRRFALALAKAVLCQQSDDDPLEPCDGCESCRLFDAGSHPDLDVVGRPRDKSTIPIAAFIGDDDSRNHQGLCHRIALCPFLGGRKVAIIDDADHFSQESANCLLKTLEEPPPKSLLILIGTSPSKQLPTIRSRSQVIRFQPLSPEAVAEILLQTGAVTELETAVRLAAFSDGSVERASELADPALWTFRELLLRELSADQSNAVRLAKAVQGFVEDAGKEIAERRARLRTLVGFAEKFYRGLMRTNIGGQVSDSADGLRMPDCGGDELLWACVRRVTTNRADSIHTVTNRLDDCHETLAHIDRNANLALVIQNWCERLAQPVH